MEYYLVVKSRYGKIQFVIILLIIGFHLVIKSRHADVQLGAMMPRLAYHLEVEYRHILYHGNGQLTY